MTSKETIVSFYFSKKTSKESKVTILKRACFKKQLLVNNLNVIIIFSFYIIELLGQGNQEKIKNSLHSLSEFRSLQWATDRFEWLSSVDQVADRVRRIELTCQVDRSSCFPGDLLVIFL